MRDITPATLQYAYYAHNVSINISNVASLGYIVNGSGSTKNSMSGSRQGVLGSWERVGFRTDFC